MDEDDKARIRNNFLELEDGLKSAIQEVCTYLMSRNIISERMKERILQDKTIGLDRDRASKLLQLIPTRGQYAYNVLYEAALEFELFDVANILKPDRAPHGNLNGPNLPLDATDSSTTMEQPLPEHYDQKMASAAAPSPDIVTDAQPEVPDSQPENPVLQTSDALETSHGSGQKFKENLLYKVILPYELKEDIMHILIICANEDRQKAGRLKADLEAQVKHPLFNHKPVNVKLLDDIMTDTNVLLDFAFQQSVCILLFATASFVEERWPTVYDHACLKAYLEDPNKNWCVIPVHTAPKKKRDYNLPVVLDRDETRGFEYWPGNEKNFCQLVKRYMEAHSSHILEKERNLEEERKKYIEKNREDLDKTLKYCNEIFGLRSSSVGENRPDVSEEVAQINISDPQEIPRLAVGTKYHIFISYCWAQQEMVLKLVEHLKALKYKIWFDLDCMSGSTVEAMAKGVEESSLVIICVSANYKKSKNCKLEAEYSYKKDKTIIPVIVEEKYRSDGWLGAIMGVNLYFNLASDFDEQIKKLCTEIDRHLASQA